MTIHPERMSDEVVLTHLDPDDDDGTHRLITSIVREHHVSVYEHDRSDGDHRTVQVYSPDGDARDAAVADLRSRVDGGSSGN